MKKTILLLIFLSFPFSSLADIYSVFDECMNAATSEEPICTSVALTSPKYIILGTGCNTNTNPWCMKYMAENDPYDYCWDDSGYKGYENEMNLWEECGLDHNIPGFACHNESIGNQEYGGIGSECSDINKWSDKRYTLNLFNTWALIMVKPEYANKPCLVNNINQLNDSIKWATVGVTNIFEEFDQNLEYKIDIGKEHKEYFPSPQGSGSWWSPGADLWAVNPNWYPDNLTWAYEHICYQSMTEKNSNGDYLNHYKIDAICDPLKTGCDIECINTRPGCENMPPDAPKDVCPDHCEVTKNLNLKYCPAECKSTEHVFYQTDDGKSQKQTCDPSKCDIKCNNQISGCEGLDPEATGSNCLPQKCQVTTFSIVGETCPQGDQGWDNCVKVAEEKPVQTTAVGCPSVDGNTCEITKEIDVDFDWSPGAMVELKCRYKSPTWPFELDLEGIAKPGCNPDNSKCGRLVTPTFSGGYLFNIGGPEVQVTPSKPGSIRIAGFDFSSLKDKNIKLCIKHPDCYVDYYDNDFGDAEDVGCDEGSVSTSSSLGNGMEQQSFAMTASPTCNTGLLLGNKYLADTTKRQIFQVGDPCARSINFVSTTLDSKQNFINLTFEDNGGLGGTDIPIQLAEIHRNGKRIAEICAKTINKFYVDGLNKKYKFTNAGDGFCSDGLELKQTGNQIEIDAENLNTINKELYEGLFPQTFSSTNLWKIWIEDKIITFLSSNKLDQCLSNAEKTDLADNANCYSDIVLDFSKFLNADGPPPNWPLYEASKYRVIFYTSTQDNPLRTAAETTFTVGDTLMDDLNDWSNVISEEREYLAEKILNHMAFHAEASCAKYACCQLTSASMENCTNNCKFVNACSKFPGDFLAILVGGINTNTYKKLCLEDHPISENGKLILDSIWNVAQFKQNSFLCAISNTIHNQFVGKMEDFFKKFFNKQPVGSSFMKEKPPKALNPAPGFSDPSPIEQMKQLIKPENQFFDNKGGNKIGGSANP